MNKNRLRTILFIGAYIAAAILLDLASGYFKIGKGLAIFYPPAGLYMAAILLLGWPALPLAFINPFFSVMVTLYDPSIPPGAAVGIGLVSMISPALILAALKRLEPGGQYLSTLRQATTFSFTVLLAVAIESLAASAVYILTGLNHTDLFWSNAINWGVSNAIPMLTLTPLLLLMFRPVRINGMKWRRLPGLLAMLIVFFAPLSLIMAFSSGSPQSISRLYFGLLPIILGALVGGINGAVWSNSWMTLFLLVTAPFYLTDPHLIVEAQFFLLVSTLAGMAMGAIVTERRRAELDLSASEQRFRLLAENATDMISQHSLDGIYLYASPASLRLMGYLPEELAGRSTFDFIYPQDQEMVREINHQNTVQPGIATISYRLRQKDGSLIWVETTSRTLLDPATGVPQTITSSTRDVTNRKQAEEHVLQLNAELERRVAERTYQLEDKNRELETFAYSVSHDLKAPLRGIAGYSHLLQEDYQDRLGEEGLLFLKNIQKAAYSMSQLIEDLLAYSRLERRLLVHNNIDYTQLVSQILEEKSLEIEQSNTVMTTSIECDQIVAEAEGLTQAMRNLIDNALKFSARSHPPRIEIGSRLTPSGVLLWVKDNGIGFDSQYQDRIFELFQRLHHSEDYPGTGIGLAIVRKIAQRLNGRAWAESSPGQGSTFYIELPQ
jgi:PAS domain S-box-containing protein